MVVADIELKPRYNRPKRRENFQYKNANWDGIKTFISKKGQSIIESNGVVEQKWKDLRSVINQTVNANVPKKLTSKRHNLAWLGKTEKKMISKKHKLFQQAKQSRTKASWDKYKSHKRQTQRAVRKAHWNYVNSVLNDSLESGNSKPFWNYVKSKRTDNVGVSGIKKNGILYQDSKDKANILNEQFKFVFTKENRNEKLPEMNTKHKYSKISDINIESAGVEKLLKNINTNKACGPDKIANTILKECAQELSPVLSHSFQLSLDTGILPSDWRNANVSPIFKKGDRHAAANYRPVSLTYYNKYTVYSEKVLSSARQSLPRKRFKPFLKPFWNHELAKYHRQMKSFRESWCRDGRPRNEASISYANYKNSKRVFRRMHRICIENYLTSIDQELDKTAEIDSDQFWKLVRHRKKKSQSKMSSGIKFHDTVVRDREQLTEQWGLYFKSLYSPAESQNFDEQWKYTVTTVVENTFNNIKPDEHVRVLPDDVSKAIETLPKGKACGEDNISYEHLIFGKAVISSALANMYTHMLRHGYIPDSLKRGIIITLHKGGNKCKDDPNNYRAITLSSTVLKVFEMVLLARCKDKLIDTLSRQQDGFQEKLGCLMTSFVLRECIYFSRENSSKLYVCFLDGKQAFDNVWHDGLFYKLIEANIDTTSLIAFKDMYYNVTSRVRYQGLFSSMFPVLQGTRQGGKSSPLFYLVFINGLIKDLERSGQGMCIYNMNLCSPTVADDMLLVSFSKYGMDSMLDICYNYARKWRYRYNANKCGIMVFNNNTNCVDSVQSFTLGRETIQEVECYTHLGLITDTFLSTYKPICKACTKLRGTFLNISSSGIHPVALNPITSRTIYRSIVIPKSLYGCELWNMYSKTDMLKLERAHRFCLKFMQQLRQNISTDFSLSVINLSSIEAMIDFKKLQFFGQLCRLPCSMLSSHFVQRCKKCELLCEDINLFSIGGNKRIYLVVEGEFSTLCSVDSGVPQGTVLGPLLFLCHINDLPSCVKSTVRLSADDCLLYRKIESIQDQIQIQEDLKALEIWAKKWGMRFNASKCYIMSIHRSKKPFTFNYSLDNHILEHVKENPYLGITISDNLKWATHINKICNRANSTLGFIRRNLKNCNKQFKETAYISLVRSVLDYSSTVWDPYLSKDITRIENIQRRAARFVQNDYRRTSSVSQMMN
ncbi:uncharacterized protein LOC128556626 [Mercenaria mercenaria]|uniref:uncharacterized protein LOC128556626 n=1 Tax=Mercenaria mercenaria TaxID=6596 RepID=UPI00234F100A|nr:uncharacterized protein LOC128556626 [Mercenaria mercenaria]